MPTPGELIDDMIARIPDWRGETLAGLRRIIHEADPQITETVKWRMPSRPIGAPVFEHNGIVCVVGVLKTRVRITLFAGASLPDPHRLFNAMLNGKSRAIDFYKGDTLNAPALKALIRAGAAYNLDKAGQAQTDGEKPARWRITPALPGLEKHPAAFYNVGTLFRQEM